MSVKVENLEKSMAKITVEVDAADFEKAIKKAYDKDKNRFNIPGFRKGHAPLSMIEKMFGEQVFYEDALNVVLDETYPDAAKESQLDIVSRPEIGVDQIGKGKNLIYTATVAVKPEVKLGEYKGVTVEKADTTVSAKDDIARIDFTGYVDDKEFEGGKGEDYDLTIGSGTFIPGFEDQLIGHKAGEEVDVNVTFPEEYGAKELAGKPALFKVTVKSVKEKQIPEADDEFASEVSEFDTLDEYKKDLEKQLKEEKEKQATTANENAVVAKVVENAEVELPEPMIESQLDNMYYDYAMRLQQQGIPMDQYLKITGLTADKIREQMKPSAEKNLKNSLVIEAVMNKENVTVSDERLEEEFKKVADQYKMKYEDLMKSVSDKEKEDMRRQVAFQETVDLLVSEANLVAPEKKAEENSSAQQ